MPYDFYMIVDVSEVTDAPFGRGERITKDKAPTHLHYYQDDAERELMRLQVNNPDSEFVMMKAVAWSKLHDLLCVVEPIEP